MSLNHYERARAAYEQTKKETISPIQVALLLVRQVERGIDQLDRARFIQDERLIDTTLRDLQFVTFELLGLVDPSTEGGLRLYQLYAVWNRTFARMRIERTFDDVAELREQVGDVKASWEDALRKQRHEWLRRGTL
ncbi:hypothetical protein GOP80_00500 [Planococcaceae bacterium Storch 2/2-2]|nr:hypothetical protein [Planococcaceae bacterium Storch 2/2-2]